MSLRRKTRRAHCVICDVTSRIEWHHAGGENHVAWFKVPLCYQHHQQLHKFVEAAGVNLQYTADPIERVVRALQAIKVCEWMLLEKLKELNSCQTIARSSRESGEQRIHHG